MDAEDRQRGRVKIGEPGRTVVAVLRIGRQVGKAEIGLDCRLDSIDLSGIRPWN